MEIDIREIEGRIQGYFGPNKRLVFWEDPSGDYRELAGRMEVEGADVVDVTGRELSCKRRVMRDEPEGRFVLYRADEPPRPEDDFLYDLKLASVPFACSMEGLWADECGIAPAHARMLLEHAKFFNSKERRGRLSSSSLPKTTPEEIRIAMLAACASASGPGFRDSVRDIVRRLLIEHATGKSTALTLISESGLASVLWGAVEGVFGYSLPDGEQPSIEDLAFRMLLTQCAALLPEDVGALSADAVRVMETLAGDLRTKDQHEALVRAYGADVAACIPEDMRSIDALLEVDALPQVDEWILDSLISQVTTGSLSNAQVAAVLAKRKHTAWFVRYGDYYACITGAVSFREAVELYQSTVSSKTTARELFDAYCQMWHAVDGAYRVFFGAYHKLRTGRFKASLGDIRARICSAYDEFLVDLTDRWQLHLLEEDGSYPPKSVKLQARFFSEEVLLLAPRAESGRRVGVIVSDGLRYECGMALASAVNSSRRQGLAGRVRATCEGALSMLPSYTQLGMAALLPDGPMRIDPTNENVLKSGEPTNGTANRQKCLEAAYPGSLALNAREVLQTGMPDCSSAPVVYVYHNVIDKRGDSRDTEGEAFKACDEALAEIESLIAELLRAGCKKVLVTSDHGFLYQDQDVEAHHYADVPDLNLLVSSDGEKAKRGRRYIVNDIIPQSDVLIEYAPADLTLEGDYRIALPKGITRLRLAGSGARYVHGGASLQESAIPVVSVERVGQSQASRQVEVQGFPPSRRTITGSSAMVTLYQVEPCSDVVQPLTVRVGVYAPADASVSPGKLLSAQEQTIELSNTAASAEDRKVPVMLSLTDDIDDYGKAVVRISRRMGATNQFQPIPGCEWEYTVSRGFGSDF